MTTLGNRARTVISDSGDRNKEISGLFMAWCTADGKILCALGSEDIYAEDLEVFVETAIEHLRKAIKAR
jgi:hypothetical protein